MKTFTLSLFLIVCNCSFGQLFGPEQEITSTTLEAQSVYAVDLDGDGDMDVLSASNLDNKIAWFKNQGNGIFSHQKVITTLADGASFVYAEDLDGDGDMDVLSASEDDDKIVWFENDGNGSFGSQLVITSLTVNPTCVHAQDLDGDGDMDVLSTSVSDAKIAWYENDGDGNFGPQLVLANDAYAAVSVYSEDLDGDGDMDVLSASRNDNEIAWFENNGNGSFGPQLIISTASDGPVSIYSEDFDGDGDMDVLSASRNDNKIAWFENDGNGGFGAQVVISTLAISPLSVYAGDIDGDGDMDVLSASRSDNKIAWYENDGNGNFGVQSVVSTDAEWAYAVHAEDLDDDGDLDILSASKDDNKIAWYENDGSGNFGPQRMLTYSANGAFSVYAEDLDNDGDLDVLSASNVDDKIAWYENFGDGDFSNQKIISNSADGARAVYAADIDSDGDIDVLSASTEDNKVAWYENNGNAEFSSELIISNTANGAIDVHANDMDGDGDLDVLSASAGDGQIKWYENDGNGEFISENFIETDFDYAASVYSEDIDNDGDVDALCAFGEYDKVIWYENDGNGVFTTGDVVVASGNHPVYSAFAEDLDGDGDLDVIVPDQNFDRIKWYENDGDGNFNVTLQVITNSTNAVYTVYADDLDNDGDLDILSASTTGRVTWYKNNGSGSFWGTDEVISYPVSLSGGSYSIYAQDLDGDGDQDVLTTRRISGKIVWFENLLGEGCMDINAENYDSTAWIENNSCCYLGGCMDNLAYNYSEEACFDNGSCQYNMTGQVFFDENENGILDGEEYGLPSQSLIVEPSGIIIMTNDEGFFSANLDPGESTLSISNTVYFPFNTTQGSVVFDSQNASDSDFLFGVSNEMPLFAVDVDFYPSGNGFLCNDWSTHNICFRNLGNVPIDGVVEVEYDELFQGHSEITAIDSVNGNTVYMSFENLLPGQMFFYDISLLTPTVDHIGENITSHARITGFFEGNEVAYGEQELTMEVACAYDPNDKQAFPQGYTEEHYLLQETQQEFLVRFQNTGNAPAQNIRIQDTLDVNFDINSLHIVANSHSVMTTIDPEKSLIDFYFEDIQLPDSVNNEPESHGLISYRVTPSADLPVGTRLENTAYIYFDNNEPIITNTTWTTIHECGGEANPSLLSGVNCEGELVQLSNDYPWIEEYTWRMDGEEISSSQSAELYITELGTYEFELLAKNDLCQETATLSLIVDDLTINAPCPGDYNCNGKITAFDLGQFISEFGCFGCLTSDFNEDYSVTAYDLSVFLSLFGTSCVE